MSARDYLSDPARLEALDRLEVADRGTGAAIEALTRVTARFFGVERATVHLVDDERQSVQASSDGVCAPDVPLGKTFCERTVLYQDLVLIPDLREDTGFSASEFVTGPEQLRFYAGMPLRTDEGYVIGTLCLLDSRANIHRAFSDHQVAVYRDLAEAVVQTMALRDLHRSSQQHLLRVGEEDAVTGLLNRWGLTTRLVESLDSSTARHAGVGLIQIRLHGLARLKHAYGSGFGNQVLGAAIDRLRPLLARTEWIARISDAQLLIARIESGAHEPDVQSALAAALEARTEAVMEQFETPFRHEDTPLHLIPQLGVAYASVRQVSLYTLLDRVDGAVYKARRDYPDESGLCWSHSGLEAEYQEDVGLENRLRQAIEEGSLRVVYQPIVDLTAGNRIVGAEALVRWPRPSGPSISPGVFVPLAEEIGVIDQLGQWVFEQACRTLRHGCEQTGRTLWMSVNVSPRQLANSALASELERIARQAGVTPAQIRLEITESGLMQQADSIGTVLERLITAGFSLALDDFGTGHSSLSRLTHLPFQVLKVDRAFVSDSPNGPGAAVVASVSTLAEALGLKRVAEGVETAEEAAYVREHGYEFGQGFLYAEPLSAEAFVARLLSSE